MSKINPDLQLTLRSLLNEDLSDEAREALGVGVNEDGTDQILVMVQFSGESAPLVEAGLTIITRNDDLVTGSIAPENVEALAAIESVQRIEGDSPLEPEVQLSVADVRADQVNSGAGIGTPPTNYTGNGVIVGIIDSGTDYQHSAFRNGNDSRILNIWDQGLTPQGAETPPNGYGGAGVVYDRTEINAALASANPLSRVRHVGGDHGTHVASIAAGNSATHPGIATGADLIVVRSSPTSIHALHALSFIYDTASSLNRPCVVNQSQGHHRGAAHDGTSLYERHINKLLGRPGRAYVKSAGNDGDNDVHHSDVVPANGSVTFQVQVRPNQGKTDLDIWYPTGTNLSVKITDPAGTDHGPHVQPPDGGELPLPVPTITAGGTSVEFAFETDFTPNHHNQIVIRKTNVFPGQIDGGNWTITLTNPTGSPVEIDAYLHPNRGGYGFVRAPAPVGESASDRAARLARNAAQSISIPGTAHEAIAVGSYVTRISSLNTPVGEISSFSSRGKTRDGRIKPDLCAPGEIIEAAQAGTAAGHVFMGGTSMAAPHVTGAIALLLEKQPTLTQEQIRKGLQTTCRTDARTGTGSQVPNNTWGYGKLDARALLEYEFPASETRNWVRIRSSLYNWTEGDTPPSFEIMSNENGRAVVELAWGSTDIPQRPARTPAEPIRYYTTAEHLTANINKADGSTMALDIPEQQIVLTGNKATWTMPQDLWDAYREELNKARQTPPQSQMGQMLYYRVRFEPTGAASAIIWPDDSSFNASPFNNRMNIIALNVDPITQVVPDRAAMLAMPRHASELEWLWQNLPEDNPDRISLANIFSHRFFTNQMEVELRGKLLTLWVQAGPARLWLYTMLDRQFRTDAGLEMTVLKQPCIRENIMLIDHLLELPNIVPHPDIAGVRVSEQLLDDVLTEIRDPNGQMNQGLAGTCAPTGIQTLLINENAAEYVRLMRGLLSVGKQATLANGDVIEPPPGIYRVALYAGAQSIGFYARTNSELGFQATMLKYAKGSGFPQYDPSAPPNDPNGINTVFQTTIAGGLTFEEIETLLEGLFNKPFTRTHSSQPTAALRNQLVTAMGSTSEPLLTVLKWGPSTSPGLHAVLSLRHESGRLMFKNPQYTGETAPADWQPNSSQENPPRLLDDPTQALESMGDDDLSGWVRAYYSA
ncbi:S8 family peptidase [Pontixanthobacter aquaemixtae]|uniref:S8 family serine peptidase n=1 Tax=Pontixanthobacter aquaemixtae TaxID=1958940 RepID=A0A844ZVR3_9SPHN|nr:S8 family peptidase [Pontixanthobacter aquaemixtae]MXO90847.1 S8 family serine peptidase [Pontixanthobacter aquaemixtae]